MKFEKIEIKVERVDLATERQEETFNEEFLTELEIAGFTMTGGFYVGLSMHCEGEEIGSDYVHVANSITKIVDEPNSIAESFEPRCLKNMAFRNKHRASGNWGADFINALIAENEGEIPATWKALAFDRLGKENLGRN